MTFSKPQDARIFIVDDQIQNVALIESLLDLEGYDNLCTTTDSRQAATIYAELKPDLVLLDFRMPHMDAVDVIKEFDKIKNDHDYIPVIILTAQCDIHTRDRALAAGASDFITKPFDNTEILLRIRNALTTRSFFLGQRHRADLLDAEVKKRTQEIFDIQLEVIRGLGRAGEYRDNETGKHVLRMSESCKIVALKMGLGDKFAEQILQASPLHDVGKIGIPDHILLKPGRLDTQEMETMKTHVSIGLSIVGDMDTPVLEMARNIAKYHHEKWDGTGYLNGLAGEEIPIESRIASVCDVFDALTSERPYKKAWPVEEALLHIKNNANRHFDPAVVDAFISCLDDVLCISQRFSD